MMWDVVDHTAALDMDYKWNAGKSDAVLQYAFVYG
jgi:hypothetical protein